MADFIRPAASSSIYDSDETDDCRIYDDPGQTLVSPHLTDSLSPHPSCAPTAAEAEAFWLAGGFDDLADEVVRNWDD